MITKGEVERYSNYIESIIVKYDLRWLEMDVFVGTPGVTVITLSKGNILDNRTIINLLEIVTERISNHLISHNISDTIYLYDELLLVEKSDQRNDKLNQLAR